MNIDLDKLSESELTELNVRVVERLRLLRQAHAQVSMLQFNVGDRVCFQADARGTIYGTLIRHNKKTVTIRTEGAGEWRVSPGLLSPAPSVSVQEAVSANVVELPRKP
jgi:hypothetical protein